MSEQRSRFDDIVMGVERGPERSASIDAGPTYGLVPSRVQDLCSDVATVVGSIAR